MKTSQRPRAKTSTIAFLLMLSFAACSFFSFAQTPASVFSVVTLQKVDPQHVVEYEKLMTENWVLAHQLRKQNGKIMDWTLYKVRFAGDANQYNYVSVALFDAFAKTEPNDNYSELMKASNPKTDASFILNRTQAVRTLVSQSIYTRIDITAASPTPKSAKFFMINFMQPKLGMGAEYVKNEKADFKPVHQAMVNNGNRTGWSLWSLGHPWGTSNNHQYVTVDAYSSYDQIAGGDDDAVYKKLFPGKDPQVAYDKIAKSRDLVRTELWEMMLTTN